MTYFKTLTAAALATTFIASAASAEDLRMSWWGGDSRHAATQAALEVCGAKHGHTIKPEFTGWGGHFEKVATQLAGGTEADIMQINWPWLPIFSKAGDGFADLNAMSDTIDLEQWPAELREASSRLGKLNGLPASLSGRIFFFNKTTYDKAGLPLPSTMEELIAAGPVFKEKLGEDYFPFEATAQEASLLLQMVLTQRTGKSMIDPASNAVNWTAQDLQWGIDFYQSLVDNHVIQPWKEKAAAGNVVLHENANWTTGKIAGAYQWDTTYFKISDPLTDEQELIPVGLLKIEGAKNDGVYRKPSMVFSISANSEKQAAASQILACLTTEADGIAAMSSARGVPSSGVAAKQLLDTGGIKQIQVDAQKMVLEAKGPAISPYNEDPDVKSAMEDTLELFAYGELDSAAAAEEMLMLVNEALEDK